MKAAAKAKIQSYFESVKPAIFWPTDLSTILNAQRRSWGAWDISVRQLAGFLVEAGVLRRAEFTSSKYRSIVRYVRGTPSPYSLAVSLRRTSFLCHQTALVLHGLASPAPTIYANKEQAHKPEPEGLSQTNITIAFKNPQRQSTYQFHYNEHHYVLVSGKNTDRLGVGQVKTPDGEQLDCTDLERTLIDIAVRPVYAGGLARVVAVYKQAAKFIDLEHLVKLLRAIRYVYPYAQSIGFLLERAGRSARDLRSLADQRSKFDFFLDYGLRNPCYDENWKVYYPVWLDRTP